VSPAPSGMRRRSNGHCSGFALQKPNSIGLKLFCFPSISNTSVTSAQNCPMKHPPPCWQLIHDCSTQSWGQLRGILYGAPCFVVGEESLVSHHLAGVHLNFPDATAGRRSRRRLPWQQSPSDPTDPPLSGTVQQKPGTAGCFSELKKKKKKVICFYFKNKLGAGSSHL
jgi:hypothetical protein